MARAFALMDIMFLAGGRAEGHLSIPVKSDQRYSFASVTMQAASKL